MTPGFDAASHELEAKLRDLRRLVAEMPFLTDEQDLLLADLTRALIAADATAHALRLSLLEVSGLPDAAPEPPAPAPLFTVAHLELPETNHDPLPAFDEHSRLSLLRELRDLAQEMNLPFDGAEELAELEGRVQPEGYSLPLDIDLKAVFPDLTYLGLNGKLYSARAADATWRLLIDRRADTQLPPDERLRALVFRTSDELMDHVDRLLETEHPEPEEQVLSRTSDLSRLFPDRRRCYPGDDRLWTTQIGDAWLLIIDQRAEGEAPRVLTFASEADRGAWLGRVYEAALSESPHEDDRPEDEDGSSRVPAPPTAPPPARPGGAERTVEEALAAPRNV